jgi:D-glycero-D-manno-heptose 1,7-bisphosphate phosphatase
MSQSQRALFLDRDGVINVDHGYVHRIDSFEFMPGIFELARFAVRKLGWPVIVVTNQAGIGRGLFDEAAFAALTRWMCERFAAEAAPLTKVYHCPYHPEFGVGEYRLDHPWRKPHPGMILQAAKDFALDLAGSALIGDKPSDIAAATAAGVGLRILLGGAAGLPGEPLAARDLEQALAILRRHIERAPG